MVWTPTAGPPLGVALRNDGLAVEITTSSKRLKSTEHRFIMPPKTTIHQKDPVVKRVRW
jgi:hypothetical protein